MERADDEDLTGTIRRRWRYLGHALRMDEKRIPPQAWTWMPTGKGNEDDLGQPLEEQCNETCKLVTSLGLTCLKKRGTGLSGELFSLPCVPDSTGRE